MPTGRAVMGDEKWAIVRITTADYSTRFLGKAINFPCSAVAIKTDAISAAFSVLDYTTTVNKVSIQLRII